MGRNLDIVVSCLEETKKGIVTLEKAIMKNVNAKEEDWVEAQEVVEEVNSNLETLINELFEEGDE